MDTGHKIKIATAVVLTAFIATAQANFAPVVEAWKQPQAKSSKYRVKRGDTLYSIAWAFNMDYANLARANNLRPPYSLYVGQLLNMDTTTASISNDYNRYKSYNAPVVTRKDQPIKRAPRTNTVKRNSWSDRNSKVNTVRNSSISWQWPTRGQLIKSRQKWLDEKGINIASKLGTPVHAAASGQVVYAGSGVKGYGKLVLIKHSNNLLSAYAMNNKVLVKTGTYVKRGQTIATVGSSPSGLSFLHFEIRRNGKAVNPKIYLG